MHTTCRHHAGMATSNNMAKRVYILNISLDLHADIFSIFHLTDSVSAHEPNALYIIASEHIRSSKCLTEQL